MNAKMEKKIRKAVKKETVNNFESFAEAINCGSFKFRLKICMKIIMRKL